MLPLGTGTRRLGAVIGGAESLPAVDSGAAAVLRLLGDLLGAGIAAAQLRQELERTALERERMRLAAEVHDGLAQDLALAMRELALLDSGPPADVAEASRQRLSAAVASAHGTVRSRLAGMIASPALGGLRPALEELCARFSHRGVRVVLRGDERLPDVSPEVAVVALRVLTEALTNVERHARATGAVLEARADGKRLQLVVDRRRARIHRGGRAVRRPLRPALDARARALGGRRAGGRQRSWPRYSRRARPARRLPRVSGLAEHLEGEACPHLAVFLNSVDELPGVLVSFYALGLRRGGWLAHRALPGDADRERALLTEAGLDVAALETDGRMVVVEMDFGAPAEGSAEPWRDALDAALERGCTGLWYARSPVGPEALDGMLEVEREWHRMSRDRPVVTICPFIAGDPAQVSEMHTRVLVPRDGGYDVVR